MTSHTYKYGNKTHTKEGVIRTPLNISKKIRYNNKNNYTTESIKTKIAIVIKQKLILITFNKVIYENDYTKISEKRKELKKENTIDNMKELFLRQSNPFQ